MRIRSFRRRVAVLAALVSGVVLAAFGVTAWWLVLRMDIARIDQSLSPPPLRPWFRRSRERTFEPTEVDWDELEQHVRTRYAAESGVPEPIILVIGEEGEVIYRSVDWPHDLSTGSFPAPAQAIPELPEFPRPPDEPDAESRPGDGSLYGPGYSTRGSTNGPWRVCTVATREATIILGLSLIPHTRYMTRVALGFLAVLPVALLVIAGGSWWLARRALRPVETLTDTAEQITARGLDQRLPVESGDVEFRRLVTVFNDMIARLERSFTQASRFSADAAHELRTPLTIMHGEIERSVQNAPDGSDEQRRYLSLLEEVQRLRAIVRKLLLLSQADSGKMPLAPEDVDLTALVQDLCEDVEAVAPDLALDFAIESDVHVSADRDLLTQSLQNLFSNAIRHSDGEGRVEVRLAQDDASVKLTIANTGRGIPQEARDRVFDRFYRVDEGRNRETGGAGLGLSLAREIIRAHGGDVVLDDSPDGLTSFTLSLPTDSALVEHRE